MTGSPDFSYLTKDKGLEVDASKLQPFKFTELEGTPTIWSLPATEENKPFFNASLRKVNSRRGRRSKVTTADTVKASREEDKEMLANFCARKWDVKDANGEDVERTSENVQAFFAVLPDYMFDDYRVFVTDSSNWLADATIDTGDGLGEP